MPKFYQYHTVEVNGFKIIVPLNLEKVLDTPVRDSYQDFLQNNAALVRRHLTCLTTLLPHHMCAGSTRRVLHVFGGVGATAQVIDATLADQGLEPAEHVFWERDPVLVEYLENEYPQHEVVHVEDSYRRLIDCDLDWLKTFDSIMFDPSVSTIKTPLIKECWAKIAAANPDLVWLSDTACAKIHLNAKFYEKDFAAPVTPPTAEGYLTAYDNWLRSTHALRIADAMREAAETYCVILPGYGNSFPIPIPYI